MMGFCGKVKRRWFGILVQIFFVCALEVLPLILGITIAVVNSDIAIGFQYWISAGTLVSFCTIIIWWFASILTNHQRFLLMVVLGKNIFIAEDDASDDDEEINNQTIVNPQTEMNFFSLAIYYIWEFPLIPKKYFSGRVRLRMKNVWKFIITFVIFSLVVGIGFLRFYVGMGFIIAVYLFVLISSFLDSFFYIPNHKPSKSRLNHAWDVSYLQRYIAIVEEGFYQSPFVVYHFAKYGLLANFILQGLALSLGLFTLFGGKKYEIDLISQVLFVSLAIFSSLLMTYILRFNITRIVNQFKSFFEKETKETKSLFESIPDDHEIRSGISRTAVNETPIMDETYVIDTSTISDPSEVAKNYLHMETENWFFRIISVLYFSVILISVSLFVCVWYFIFMGWGKFENLLIIEYGFGSLGTMILFSFFLFKRYDKDTVKVQSLFFLILLSMMS
jgi:hypothetical protein